MTIPQEKNELITWREKIWFIVCATTFIIIMMMTLFAKDAKAMTYETVENGVRFDIEETDWGGDCEIEPPTSNESVRFVVESQTEGQENCWALITNLTTRTATSITITNEMLEANGCTGTPDMARAYNASEFPYCFNQIGDTYLLTWPYELGSEPEPEPAPEPTTEETIRYTMAMMIGLMMLMAMGQGTSFARTLIQK